jgi:hypothetical protein
MIIAICLNRFGIYVADVMQSSEPFYFVLSLEESLTDNVGQNVQNKAYNVDIALVDSKKDKQLVTSLTEIFHSIQLIVGTQH